jgi:adenylate cyclase
MTPSDDAARWRDIARTLLGEATLTSAEVAARAGYPLDGTRRMWRAIGLPPIPDDERAFAESDVEIMRSVQLLLSRPGTDVETAVQVARVIGRAMAQVADAIVGVAAESGRELAAAAEPPPALAEVVAGLAPAIEPFLLHVWRHHLLAGLLRAMAGSDAATDPVQAVGFVDLVGFTALAQRLETTTLTAVLDCFEALAYERIVERGGRVIKMVGDEVMFVVGAPAVAAEMALALLEACAADPRVPDARAGIAVGPTRAWEGDLFGPTVNLASRLVGVARPGTVLASEELGAALDAEAFVLRHLRPQPLHGLGRVRSWVVRRAVPRRP